MSKIFVSICSYRDPLLHITLQSLIDNKSHKHEATYSILEQTAHEDSLIKNYPELVNRKDVIYKRIDPEYVDGVGWARHVNSLNVRDEDFFYQIDSHMVFDPGWDRFLVEDYRRGRDKCGSDKVIICGATKAFTMRDGKVELYPEECTTKVGYFTLQRTSHLLPGAHGDHHPVTKDVTPAFHICAGNFFTHTQWLKNVGIDHKVYFDGEEPRMSIQSFACGYHMFHHTEVKCYHYENTHFYITKHWIKPIITEQQYTDRVQNGIKYWKEFIEGISEDILQAYYEYSGVDYINGVVEDRARCVGIQWMDVEPYVAPDMRKDHSNPLSSEYDVNYINPLIKGKEEPIHHQHVTNDHVEVQEEIVANEEIYVNMDPSSKYRMTSQK